MTLYDAVKFVHVLAAIVWVGGGLATQVFMWRMRRAAHWEAITGLAQQAAWAGNRIFLPSSLVVLATGIWGTVLRWSFSDLWVTLGLAGIVVTAVTGSAFLGPQGKKVAELMVQPDPPRDEVYRRMGTILKVGQVDLVVLTAVVFVMVVKPG